MKKLALILALIVGASSIFAADAANDVLLNQRNSANDDNVQRNVTATANSLFAFDASLVPTATSAPILASVQANASGGLLLKNFSGTTVMTVGPGSGTGVAFNASGLTSVNSVTAASGSALTFTGGDSGASLVLGALSGSDANAIFSPKGIGAVKILRTADKASYLSGIELETGAGAGSFYPGLAWRDTALGRLANIYSYREAGSFATSMVFQTSVAGSATPTSAMRIDSGQKVFLLATGAAGTATGVSSGGLQSANFGLSTVSGGASYFGGAATFAGAVTHTLGTNYPPQTAPASPASGWVLYTDSGDGNKLKAKASTGTVVTIGTP